MTFFIYDAVTSKSPDFNITMISNEFIAEAQYAPLIETAEKVVGDLNGDGQTIIIVTPLYLTNDQIGVANMQKMSVTVIERTNVLYLLDRDNADNLIANECLEPLSSTEFAGRGVDQYVVDIGSGWFAGFRLRGQNPYDPELDKVYAAASDLLSAMLTDQISGG